MVACKQVVLVAITPRKYQYGPDVWIWAAVGYIRKLRHCHVRKGLMKWGDEAGGTAGIKPKKKRRGRGKKRERNDSIREYFYILVSNEAADRDTSPAHTAHQAATHHAAGQRLTPWTVAIVAVGIGDVHGNRLGANKGILSTAAHGRVEGTSRHGGVVVGGRR